MPNIPFYHNNFFGAIFGRADATVHFIPQDIGFVRASVFGHLFQQCNDLGLCSFLLSVNFESSVCGTSHLISLALLRIQNRYYVELLGGHGLG